MLPPWNGITTLARFTKFHLNTLVQLLIEWELFLCGGNLLVFNANFVQRFCCFKKSKGNPSSCYQLHSLSIIKSACQRDGVFVTWGQLMYMYLHNRVARLIISHSVESVSLHSLLVSALVSGSSCPGARPGREHCVVFLRKTLYSQCLSPPRCINRCKSKCKADRTAKVNFNAQYFG